MKKFIIKPLVFSPWVHQPELQGKLHAATVLGDYFVWLHRGQFWRWSHPFSGPTGYEKAQSIDHAVTLCNLKHEELLLRELVRVTTCGECLFCVKDADGHWCTENASIVSPHEDACDKFRQPAAKEGEGTK